MKQVVLQIKSNRALNSSVFAMELCGDVEELRAGSFVEVALAPYYLRRPFGVAESRDGSLTILYKVVGGGTEYMTGLQSGDSLDVLVELGNGFNEDTKKPLLIGGGIGAAPLLKLAREFFEKGVKPQILLGAASSRELFGLDGDEGIDFARYGNVIVATDDGSAGLHGNVVDALKSGIDFDRYYACGPMPMLRALCAHSTKGEVSLEARMGCGFGACMGCSIMTKNGTKRVCKEGPVFDAEEVIFDA